MKQLLEDFKRLQKRPVTNEHTPLIINEQLEQNKQRQEQMQLEREIEHTDRMIAERDHEIRHIEEEIYEVNDIFRDLATHTKLQGENLNLMDDNIMASVVNVKKGHQQLRKANTNQKKKRTSICAGALLILLGVATLIFFLVIIQPEQKKD